jgi:hypothetical protein
MSFLRNVLAVFAIAHLPLPAFAESGEAFPGKPYSLALEGPASVPVSLEIKPGASLDAPSKLFLEIYVNGKGLKRVTMPPGRQGSTTLDVPAGRHVYEFRADPASRVALLAWDSPAPIAAAGADADPFGRAEGPSVSRTKGAEQLARIYTPTLGEVIAADLFQVLVGMRPIESFTSVSYDKGSRTIVLSIFGTENSVDRAKQAVEQLRAKAIDPLTYRVEIVHGIKLEDADFSIRYLNRTQDYREVVRREGGKYFIGD